jgi:hypothetical protein
MNKKGKWITISIAAIVLIILVFFWVSAQQQDILDVNLRDHSNLVLHYHPFLEIEVLGKKQVIPANIGISEKGMRVIHTHDSSGELHVETPRPQQLFLNDFFSIWGKTFDEHCFEKLCSDETHVLEMFVNNVSNKQFGFLPLKDKDVISIVYRER